MHDGASRVGVFDASESYGHARHARRVGYIAVTVGGSKKFRRPTSNFEEEFVRQNLVIDLGSISGRSQSDLGFRVDLGQPRSKLPVAPPTYQ